MSLTIKPEMCGGENWRRLSGVPGAQGFLVLRSLLTKVVTVLLG